MFINNCKHGADCPFDLDAPSYRSKMENVAFSIYAKHSQECEDIINLIGNRNDRSLLCGL